MQTNVRVLLAIFMVVASGFGARPADASCQCACVNGTVRAVCSSAIDLKPICAPRVCRIAPPRVRPITPPTIPPVGTSRCRPELVWTGHKYEWVKLCE